MGFSVTGYVLEKPRVGSSNSPFTLSPDNLIADQGAFNAAFPSDESASRAEYMVQVFADGDLHNAEFGWTRNDLIQRFYWEGRDARFKPLPGAARVEVGVLSADANTARLKVPAPTAAPLSSYPVRVSVGVVGAGVTFTLQTVPTDADFTPVASGSVQVSLFTGNLNWNAADLTSFDQQKVFFQRQQFFTTKESTGNIGTIPPTGSPTFLLNPIPGPGQHPLIRFGFGLWLTAIEGITSPDPAQGTVEWDPSTGLLRFNSADLTANRGASVYYDGVMMARRIYLPRQTIGTVSAPGTVSNQPSVGSDLIFRASSIVTSGSATFPNSNVLQTGASLSGVATEDIVVLTSGPFSGTRRRIVTVGSGTVTVQPSFPSRTACHFSIERKDYQFPQTMRYDTLSGNPNPSTGQVAIDASGAVATSASDKGLYGPKTLSVTFGDLPIENGIALRLFRTPVDPEASDPNTKDISAFYYTADATISDPLVGAPFFPLPIVPIDDAAFPLTFKIQQGTGSYPEGNLPRLDGASPPSASAGYALDFEQRQVNLVARKNNSVIPLVVPTGSLQLPDPGVDPDNIVLELDTGSGFVALTQNEDVLLDSQSGVLRFVNTDGTTVTTGTAQSVGATLVDSSNDFIAAGVIAGDLLFVPSGTAKGIYTITARSTTTLTLEPPAPVVSSPTVYEVRRGKEILADRFFQEVFLTDPSMRVERIRQISADSASNSPRQVFPLTNLSKAGIRLGTGDTAIFATVSSVPTDADFSNPSALASNVVEVSLSTGNLNFPSSALGTAWFYTLLLSGQTDYRLDPINGLILLTERLLANEEMRVTYRTMEDDGSAGSTVVERATFLVRKEIGTIVSPGSVTFNPLGKSVAANPAPSVYRGGRPQDTTQVTVDIVQGAVTFLGSNQITDALPAGPTLTSSERVYIDYYIYQALGGENTTSLLSAPVYLAAAYTKNEEGPPSKGIVEDSDHFYVPGNRTAEFPANSILRVGTEELYYLDTPIYDSGEDETKVVLQAPQKFRNSASQPRLYVTSGIVRQTSTPTYFVLEPTFNRSQGADSIPRGMNVLKLPGDRTATYQAGMVIYLSAPGTIASQDYYLVQGSSFKEESGQTEITIATTTARQYNPPPDSLGATWRRSVRPILEASASSVKTSRSPVLEQGFVLFRQVEGEVGEILASVPAGEQPATSDKFSIDAAGTVKFTEPLKPSEEFSILYTGYVVKSGTLRASYTHMIVPNAVNGLESQSLLSDSTAYAPDTFFYRVETITNFRGEVAKKYKDEAKASVPSGGPVTSNASKTPLYDEGTASVFYPAGRLYNEDIIARATLKYYNDIIHYLEDVLQNMDGRVVGDTDGRFKFDGTLGTTVTDIATANNQIDDRIEVSPFPVKVTFPGLSFSFSPTTLKAYEPSPDSRFFPTKKKRFGITVVGGNTGAETGDPLMDLGIKNLTNVSTIFRRKPRAMLVEAATASVALKVDNSQATDVAPDGKTTVMRPGFAVGMKVIVPGYLNEPGTTIASIVGNTVTLAAPVTAPRGATLTLSAGDSISNIPPGYQRSYRTGFDIEVNSEQGSLTYVEPYFPFDGTFPLIPEELSVQDPNSGEQLQTTVRYINKLTEPEKFPALFGQPLNDDGDQGVPYVNPSLEQEKDLSAVELALVGSSGAIRANTTAEFIGTGSLNVAGTQITLTSGSFGTPLPQLWDLVYIVDGVNGSLPFRRISGVLGTTLTVDVPYPVTATGFTFMVTVGNDVATGTATSSSTTSVTQLAATFPNVKPGHTLVFTSVSNVGVRRQVVSAVGDTITFTPALSGIVPGTAFRVTDSLSTYSDTAGLVAALDDELDILQNNANSSKTSLDAFFNAVFTNVVPSTAGSTAGTTLTSGSGNFLTSGVGSAHYVYIEAGPCAGVYPISQVTGPTTLTVDPSTPFPQNTSVTFRVVSAFGVVKKTLLDVSKIRSDLMTFTTETVAFRSLVTTAASVATPAVPGGDSNYYARRLREADYAAREATVTARQASLVSGTGPIPTLEGVLANGDRLYDKRFTWIDARINLEKGLLVKQALAEADRIKAQADTVKQLIKLLAVE